MDSMKRECSYKDKIKHNPVKIWLVLSSYSTRQNASSVSWRGFLLALRFSALRFSALRFLVLRCSALCFTRFNDLLVPALTKLRPVRPGPEGTQGRDEAGYNHSSPTMIMKLTRIPRILSERRRAQNTFFLTFPDIFSVIF